MIWIYGPCALGAVPVYVSNVTVVTSMFKNKLRYTDYRYK